MSKLEKLKSRLLSEPKDFTFGELENLLKKFGYILNNGGATNGSAVKFINTKTGHILNLHKPHPSPILKEYLIKYIIAELKQGGILNEK